MKMSTLSIIFVMCASAAHATTLLDETRDGLICEGHGTRVMLNQDGVTWSRDQRKYDNPLIQVGDVDVDAECRYARTGKD